ncbi:YciI family protein [Rhizobium sp. AAP43]|uniref:YciI family protein n=1 Tax=Rhizobium sp. AAP43 TaxID=1523420 RepID=UPI0006B90794|nr:YciI family protein [Rhizobium sp. AAP43]KPF41151.1 dehydrogenase [Rhizobium sp. AAP43]
MKYLCQVWLDETVMQALSDAERRELDRQSLAYDLALAERGHLVMASPLTAPETALTLRVRQGDVLTTDGPFTESREHLGGFLLIEARDLSEVTEIVARVPIARYGSIEIRALCDIPVHDAEPV